MPTASRRVILAGATGLVGQHLLQGLLADPGVSEVHILSRRSLPLAHPRLTVHIVDFQALPPLPVADELYLALGSTIRVAGSQAAFRAIDFGMNLAVARAALAAGVRRIALVSASGADARSRVFYSRVKGELEEALAALGAEGLLIARPALLLGDRAALGQPARRAEKWAMAVFSRLAPVLPASLRPIAAQDVARALLARLPATQGQHTLSSAQLAACAREA